MRRLRRILLWTILILCLPIVLIAGGAAAFIWLAGEETWTAVLRQGTEAASTPDQQISVDGFRRDEAGVLRLARLAIADANGDWLVVEDIAIDMHPSRLLGRTVHLEMVSAGRVEILRSPPPGPQTETASEPFAFPERIEVPALPVAIDLKRLDVAEIVLAEGVAPERTRVALTGSASSAPDALTLALRLDPLDLGDSRLKANLSLDPATGRLTADVDGSLPVIEPLASAVAAPDGSRLNLSLNGGGPLSGARLDFALNIDGVLDLVGDLNVSVTEDAGLNIDLNGFASLLGGVTTEPATYIGPAVEFRISAQLPETDRVLLESAVIDAQFLHVEARGNAGLSDQTMQVTASGRFRHHAGLDPLLQGAAFSTADFTAEANGPFRSPAASLTIDLSQPAFDGFSASTIALVANANVRGEAASGKLAVDISEPKATDPAMGPLLGQAIALRTDYAASASDVRLTGLRLDTVLANLTGDLSIDPSASLASGEIVLTADDLSAVPQLADLMITGQARMAVRLNQLGPESGEVGLDARIANLEWRDPALQSLTGASLDLAGTASPTLSGKVTLKAEAGLSGNVDVSVSGEQITGVYRIALPSVPSGFIPPEISGVRNVSLAGDVSGTVDNPVVQARLSTADIEINGVPVDDPVVTVTARDLMASPDASVRAAARVMNEPLDFASGFIMDPATGQLTIRNLDLDWRSVQVAAAGTADINTLRTGINADINADLSELSDLAGQPLAGKLTASLASRQAGAGTDAVLNLRLEGLEGGGASVERLDAAVTLRDALAAVPGLEGNIRISGITTGDATVREAAIDLSGNVRKPAADIRIEAAAPAEAVLTTSIRGDLTDPDALRATVQNIRLSASQGEIANRSPFTVTARGEAVELSGLNLVSSLGGSVNGDASYAPDRIFSAIDIAGLKVGPLAALAGMEGFLGDVNARIRLDTTDPSDRAAVTLRVTDLRVPDVAADTPFSVSLDAAWDGREAKADARVTGPFEHPMVATLTGGLPAGPGQGLPAFTPGDKVVGGISWQGDIARLLALLPESDHLADGAALIDVKLDGTWANPALHGTIAINDARYENLLSGTQLSGIGLNVSFDDSGAGKFTLAANGPEGGTISGAGDLVLVGPEKGAEIRISLRDLLALRRDEVRAVVAGDTLLTWDGERVKVEVRKVLERVDVFLAAPDLPPSVVSIELERDRDRAAEEEEEAGPDLPVDLDIQVSSPGQFFVRGRGLESEWRGDLIVQGTASDPVIRSRFEAVRGSLSLLGRDFRLDKGELGLDESFKPEFRIELVRETPDLTGRIIVSGSPEQPDISFTSEPELPPDEVLPRVLFDKAKQSLSPLEAVNLAQGIRTLTNGKPGTTDRIRDAVGLDVLRFEEGDSEDSAGAVSVGRYVREGVYVGAKKSVDSDAGSVVVEIDVLPNVKVDTEVGQDGGTSTGITWEKKY